MTVTIRDVARCAGVSSGTVSRAFNGYDDINESTKEHILAVAKDLGYVPNLIAKTLSTKGLKTMAIILSGFMVDRGLTEELVIKMLRGANKYALERQMELATYMISSEYQKEKTYEQFCREHSLDGALIFGLKTSDTYYSNIKYSRIPCVTIDVMAEGDNIGYVGTDNFNAYRELTQRVIDCNHRKLIFLNGRKMATVCHERLQGLMEAVNMAGLSLKEEDIIYTDFNADCAEQIAADYIKEHGRDGATAFLCAGDIVALGAIKAIRKCGYEVGRDFSVAGFDGLNITRLSSPSIATVDQNMEEKGYIAAKLLHDIVSGGEAVRKQLVPYKQVEGDSLGYCRE